MISTADLQDWMKADDADAPVLRQLEEAAVKAIEQLTGRYYGVEDEIVEVIRFRGFPLSLSNDPLNDTITLLENWDGTAWATVSTDQYYLHGSYIYSTGVWPAQWSPLTLTRFRVTYDAGYTVDPLDADVWDAPVDIQQAVKLLVGHWMENRESVAVGATPFEVPMSVQMLVAANVRVAV